MGARNPSRLGLFPLCSCGTLTSGYLIGADDDPGSDSRDQLINTSVDMTIKNLDNERSPEGHAVDRRIRERLLEARKILVFGEVNQPLAEAVVAQLLAMDAERVSPIHVLVNSQGGHVESADTIHDVIRFVHSPVYVIGTGWVASAGVHLYLAAERERRLCLPNTRFMIHEPSGGVGGQVSDIEIELEQIIELRRRIRRMIAERTGRRYEDVERDTQRNCWLTATQAVEYGLVGKIVSDIGEVPGSLATSDPP